MIPPCFERYRTVLASHHFHIEEGKSPDIVDSQLCWSVGYKSWRGTRRGMVLAFPHFLQNHPNGRMYCRSSADVARRVLAREEVPFILYKPAADVITFDQVKEYSFLMTQGETMEGYLRAHAAIQDQTDQTHHYDEPTVLLAFSEEALFSANQRATELLDQFVEETRSLHQRLDGIVVELSRTSK